MFAFQLLMWVVLVSGDEQAKKPPEPPINAQPNIPIPTGSASRPSHHFHFEWSSGGKTIRYGKRDEAGASAEWAIGRLRGSRVITPVAQTEMSRTWVITRRNAAGTKTTNCGITHLVYIANSWDGRCTVEFTPRGPRIAIQLTHWVLEGVAVGVGVDTTTGVVLHHERHFDDDDVIWPVFVRFVQFLYFAKPLIDYLEEQRRIFTALGRSFVTGRR